MREWTYGRSARRESPIDKEVTGEAMGTGRRRFRSVLATAVVVLAAGLLLGTGNSFAAGGIDALAPGNGWCVSEDGKDGAGNENACVDGKGLGNGVSALQVSPDGKRVFVLGFDSFLGATDGDSITTYDRDPLGGSLEVDPRANACRSAFPSPDCSQGGSQAVFLNAPNGIAVSPNSENVYVSARRSSSVTVFDYLAFPSEDSVGEQGPLSRKVAPNGCLTDAAVVGCTDVRGLATARDVVVSPDGATVYTAGNLPNGGIAVFDRAADGVLTQKTLPTTQAGCISDTGSGGFCTDGNNLEPIALAISDDGENLYAASYSTGNVAGDRDTVTVFDVNPDGSLTQKAGLAGCFSETGSGSACTVAQGLQRPVDIAITPDGKSVYVATDLPNFEDAPDVAPMVAFDRDTDDGTLTRRGCFAAEGALGCTTTSGLYRGLTVTATDEAVYYGSQERNADQGTGQGAAPSAMVVLSRNPSDGSLTQAVPSGCWAQSPLANCRRLSTIGGVRGIAVSPDGNSLYAGSGSGITVFDRDNGQNPVTTIDSGPSGNITETSVTFTFSSDKAISSYDCGLDGEYQECTSPVTYENLEVGGHFFQVIGYDRFNRSNLEAPGRNFGVADTTPPETAILSGPPASTTATSAEFTFESDESGSTFECSMDGGVFVPCASPKQYTDLGVGDHSFKVRAIDAWDNVDPTPAIRSFMVYQTGPGPDTRVDATVTTAKVQKQKRGKISVAVKVKAGEQVKVKASGSARKGKLLVAFKVIGLTVESGRTATLRLVPKKSGQGRLLAAALLGSKRTIPKLIVTVTDGAENTLTARPKVKLVGAPRRK